MLIQQFQAPEDGPSRALPTPTTTNTPPVSDNPQVVVDTPVTAAADQTTTVLPPPDPQPVAAGLPSPAVQATPLQAPPSFLAFFIQHLRTDPQMRLCAHSPSTQERPITYLTHDRARSIRILDFDGPHHFVCDPFHNVCRHHVFPLLAAPDRKICAPRPGKRANEGIFGWHHPLSTLCRAMRVATGIPSAIADHTP
jgi:hypothetical protein